MPQQPSTQYTKAPDGVRLAYQVTGDGPLDLVMVLGFAYPIDLLWENADFLHFADGLRRFSRTIWPERRGAGASGGDIRDHFVESVADSDLSAVIDAAECSEVVLVATGMRGPLAITFAANRPERVSALVLFDTFARLVRDADYPWGVPREVIDKRADDYPNVWGSEGIIQGVAPSKVDDELFNAWIARCQRLGLGPEDSAVGYRLSAVADVRALLPSVKVRTLIIHRSDDAYIPVENGRYLAEQIPGAKYVELPGADHYFFLGDSDSVCDEIEEFLTGAHQGPEGDVVTVTVLFTDIVSSTEQAARIGHRKWAQLTNAHDAMVREVLRRYRGREVKNLGDGFLAMFDATTRAVRSAVEIVKAAGNLGLEVRAGVHTGEVEVRTADVLGLPVHIAKRICDLAEPGTVLVSEVVPRLVTGSGIEFDDRGDHGLKGVPGTWKLLVVRG